MVPYGSDAWPGRTWNFAVRESEPLTYRWPLTEFGGGMYHLQVHGPNGFFCEMKGSMKDPDVVVEASADTGTGKLKVVCTSGNKLRLQVKDVSYAGTVYALDHAGEPLWLDVRATGGWYDIVVEVEGYANFHRRFAGHVETGKPSITDPLMGSMRK